MNYSCPKYQTTRSIRAESWIDTICICPKRILKILLYWSACKSQKDILDLLSVSRATLSKFKLLIIAAVKKHYEENLVQLGGPDVNIQADETMLNHKVKSHRGRSQREQVWCLAIIDASFRPSKIYLEMVEN